MNILKEFRDYKYISIQCNELGKLMRDIEECAQRQFNFIEILITTLSNIFDFIAVNFVTNTILINLSLVFNIKL